MDIEEQIPSVLALQKGGIFPSLAKRGRGRFSQQDVFPIMDSLLIRCSVLEIL
jgi:hypothetical protein